MKSLFKKILIANRGEIAVRVIRAAKELGIKTVAVYTDSDKDSLHRFLANEDFYIGSSSPEKSYLNIEKIIYAAKKKKVEAIHPGYGFLSQNPKFVKRCEEEGIVFIGPPSRIHESVGNKINAKKIAKDAGVPVVSGPLEPIDNEEKALDAANKIGYPVLIKPVLGGGGIGMKVCKNEKELVRNFESLQKISRSAFGNELMYLEKYYPYARHIEVQILASKKTTVHLFERDCSLQRRFQKVMEEAPSPVLDEDVRRKILDNAMKIANTLKYVNAGTVEFIYVPKSKKFYFIEVNSRIQVEHPVTELLTGVDLVKQQFFISAGNDLSISQEDIKVNGHAIEARIYAEDPLNSFMPVSGRVLQFIPPGGYGVRVDSAIYSGYKVPSEYDTLMAKLIVWGRDRGEAIRRMTRALEEFIIEGISTNISLHKAIVHNSSFIKGKYDTMFIERKKLGEKSKKYITKRERIPVFQERKREIIYVNSAWKASSRLI